MTSASFPTSFLSVNPQLGRLAASPTEATPCREPLQAPEKAGNPHLDFPDSVKPYGSTAGGRKDRTVSPQARRRLDIGSIRRRTTGPPDRRTAGDRRAIAPLDRRTAALSHRRIAGDRRAVAPSDGPPEGEPLDPLRQTR